MQVAVLCLRHEDAECRIAPRLPVRLLEKRPVGAVVVAGLALARAAVECARMLATNRVDPADQPAELVDVVS
ncbi:MAG: hypothetical protein KC479_01780, partial [Dehalococcoidia bacterium]|nr:hypothetical protein [Dehalococcoidia bacterium]